MADDLAPRRFSLRDESELLHHLEHDLLVIPSLLQVLFPLLPKIVVDDALESA